MNSPINVLYQFNEKYVPYAGVSMTSLFENNKAAESIYIYVLGESLSAQSVCKFRELENSYSKDGYVRKIVFIDTDKLIEKMKQLNMPTYRGSYAANMRLFVSDILGGICGNTCLEKAQRKMPEEVCEEESKVRTDVARLLYLDADTVVEADISDMYNSDIKTVGMVYDTLGCAHKYEIGLTAEEGYYNSGVILYDLKRWEELGFTDKIVEHVKNVRAQYPSPDQDLLNVVVRDEITPLPISCNFQPHLLDYGYGKFMKVFNPHPFYSENAVEGAKLQPVILHCFRYIGEFPWHRNNVHPFNEYFDKYLAISPWKDYEKKPSEGGIVMKVEKVLYRILPKGMFLTLFSVMFGSFYRKANKMSQESKISKQM